MKGISVDDEARSRRTLKALCEEYCNGLEIIGLADSVSEARVLLEKEMPELVFLDIRMPLESGFELLKYYKNDIPFEVIFTTAYDEYAKEAFQFAAVDYLLKPIEINELVKAVQKAQKLQGYIDPMKKFEFLKELLVAQKIEKIALNTAEGFTYVQFNEIIRCEAQSNYTQVIMTEGSSILITKTLKHYEDLLLEKDFFRVHKSHLVNLHAVRRFIRSKKGSMIEMKDGVRIEVSARKKEALLERLSRLE